MGVAAAWGYVFNALDTHHVEEEEEDRRLSLLEVLRI
jgi:hypothetical protein